MESLFKNKIFDKTFDLIVIGGGITGAGIALDAQSRGLSVCLVEKQDFAQGTSSRSTKLIHGGLRYLKQLNFSLVREVGLERKVLFNNARHLVLPLDVVLPVLKQGTLGKYSTRIALIAYEFLANVEKKDQNISFTKQEMLERYTHIDQEKIKAGIQYVEYMGNDARLVIEILKKASELGAAITNYTEVIDFLYDKKKVAGVKVKNNITGEERELHGTKIVNATGPWVDNLCKIDKAPHVNKLILTKGVHIVVSANKLPLDEAFYFDTPDKRMIFVIPKYEKTYIGTTDTFFTKKKLSNPRITKKDAQYLLDAVNNLFDYNLQLNDIESSWSGLRPLIQEKPNQSPSEISRKDEIFLSSSGLISIAGGKLTGYRLMAQKVVNGLTSKPCVTEKLRLSGGEYENDQDIVDCKKQLFIEGQRVGLSKVECEILYQLFGKNAHRVFEHHYKFREKHTDYNLPLLVFLALDYSLRYEFVYSLTDFYVRRTDWFYFYIELVKKTAKDVAHYMEDYFDWSVEKKNQEIDELEKLVKEATIFE